MVKDFAQPVASRNRPELAVQVLVKGTFASDKSKVRERGKALSIENIFSIKNPLLWHVGGFFLVEKMATSYVE